MFSGGSKGNIRKKRVKVLLILVLGLSHAFSVCIINSVSVYHKKLYKFETVNSGIQSNIFYSDPDNLKIQLEDKTSGKQSSNNYALLMKENSLIWEYTLRSPDKDLKRVSRNVVFFFAKSVVKIKSYMTYLFLQIIPSRFT